MLIFPSKHIQQKVAAQPNDTISCVVDKDGYENHHGRDRESHKTSCFSHQSTSHEEEAKNDNTSAHRNPIASNHQWRNYHARRVEIRKNMLKSMKRNEAIRMTQSKNGVTGAVLVMKRGHTMKFSREEVKKSLKNKELLTEDEKPKPNHCNTVKNTSKSSVTENQANPNSRRRRRMASDLSGML